MVEDSGSRVPYNDACEQVGRAIYGGDWIGSLTKREEWLIQRYVEGRSRKGDAASTMPGQTTYVVAGVNWAEYPETPELLAEAASARNRWGRSKEQWDEVVDWLENHGFDSDASSFDRDALLGELEKDFPSHTETQIYHTGAPGHPTSKSLVEREFQARIKGGRVCEKLVDEAKALAAWLKKTHPGAPPMTAGTVENVIRSQHRVWKESHKNKSSG